MALGRARAASHHPPSNGIAISAWASVATAVRHGDATRRKRRRTWCRSREEHESTYGRDASRHTGPSALDSDLIVSAELRESFLVPSSYPRRRWLG